MAIHSEIEAKLEELKTSGGDGLEEGWGLNERGEVSRMQLTQCIPRTDAKV